MKFLYQICLVVLFSLLTLTAVAQAIDLNTATAEELTALDGIGPTKAAAIIKYREVNGPFSSIEDLANVKGIGDKTLEKNRTKLTVETMGEKAASMKPDTARPAAPELPPPTAPTTATTEEPPKPAY